MKCPVADKSQFAASEEPLEASLVDPVALAGTRDEGVTVENGDFTVVITDQS